MSKSVWFRFVRVGAFGVSTASACGVSEDGLGTGPVVPQFPGAGAVGEDSSSARM